MLVAYFLFLFFGSHRPKHFSAVLRRTRQHHQAIIFFGHPYANKFTG
jgi:hypothetical protein